MAQLDESFDLMTVEEVAELLGISRLTLLNRRSRGEGPRGFRVGRTVRYRRSAVQEYLAAKEQADKAAGRAQ